ncbi:MAG TPA: UvrD-helicase domain-containing protein [Egibacteraceae bacterium]|nr:UvrD-helicase domain-containing protein [Egibacteraceae bacterium]
MSDSAVSHDAETGESPLLQGLNPEQRAAVLHEDGPLLIVAGAGSGKTRVLTHRIAHLIQARGVHPYDILAITFTNKAADEMKERVGAIVGERLVGITREPDGTPRVRRWGGMWVSTFHSACARLLRAEAPRLGYDPSFTIYDAADSTRLVGLCISELGIDAKKVTPRGAAHAISAAKNELVDFDTFGLRAEHWYDKQVAEVYRLYQQRLHRASAFDFDDLLVKTVELLQLFDDVLERYRSQFRHVLVDGWQDTNRAQYEMVRLLSEQHRNLTVVGDSDQCFPPGTTVRTPAGDIPIEQIAPGSQVLGTGGRATPAIGRVTAVMPRRYAGPLWTISAAGKTLRGTPHHVVPARIGEQPGRFIVYLMERADRGYRLGVTKGARPASKKRPSEPGYVVRANQEHADKLWILRLCVSLPEAVFWESLYAASYGLPTACFHGLGRKLSMDEPWLARLYEELDTQGPAKQLMEDLYLHPDYPHYRPANGARRQSVTLLMFGDQRAEVGYHRIQWSSIRPDVAERLLKAGFSVRDNGKGGFRIESSRKGYPEALSFVRGMVDDGGLEIRRRLFMESKHYELLPLSHLHPGMRIIVEDNGQLLERCIDTVEQEDYEGPVYDLEVTPTHTYVAQGVLVHNSIYRFRGADIRNILDFERDFPDATRITLDRNYRSTQTILDAANSVIANNTERIPKHLWTDAGEGVHVVRYSADSEHDEAAFVAEEVDRLCDAHGYRPGDCAVFYRTNAQSRVLEEVLIRLGLPYQVVGGTRFYERKEIKDILAYLRLLVNPADDISAKRVLNEPRRGIGAKTEEALDLFAGRERITFIDACRRVEENHLLAARTVGKVLDFVGLIDGMRTAAIEEQMSPREVVELVWTRTGYLSELEAERTVEALGRAENVRELASVAEDFAELQPDASLPEFLERVSLVSEADEIDPDTSRLTLMTMHNAKGLEYPVVFIVGMEESVFPHHRSFADSSEMEEERRLCYVAMTRAQQRLYVSSAWSRTLFGGTNSNPPSRFLKEVPADLVEHRAADRGGPSRRAVARVGPRAGAGVRDADGDDLGDLGIGDRILHPTFGPGKILELSGRPGSEEALIRFDEYGTKRMLLAYAPLVRA